MAEQIENATPAPPVEAPKTQDQAPSNLGNKKVEEIISTGDLEAGFKRLIDFSAFFEKQSDELTQYQNSLATVEKEFDKGKINISEKLLQTNRIADGFLHFIQELKREMLRTFSFGGSPVLAGKFKDQSAILQIVTEEMLHGRYSVQEPIPGGNSGFYFKAFNSQLRQKVVLKVFKITHIEDLPKDEIEIVLKLKHRNIIRIIDHNFERLPAYVILEYINGIQLGEAIKLFQGFSLTEALRTTRLLISALSYVRKRGIRHSNIRPSKIYIDDEGLPMISSIDIIKQEKDALRSLSRFKEECRYLSPEALDETLVYDDLEKVERSDQFSLGLILLEMLTAKALFEDKTVPAIFKDRQDFFADPNKRLKELLKGRSMHERLVKTIKTMLAEESEKRYPDLLVALEELKNIPDSLPAHCQAMAAYDSIKNHHHDLASTFYKRFLSKLPKKMAAVKEKFTNLERQDMMLRKSIEVVLNIESTEKQDAFLAILARPVHKGYLSAEYYKIFLETLRDTVLDLLPDKWPHKDAAVKAWDNKIQECLRLVGQYLLSQKKSSSNHIMSLNTPHG